MSLVHATCVAVAERGLLLIGPSGSGKSDLAFRLIEGGARLVSDDQVEIAEEGGVLLASPPPSISGMMEVRGVGLVRLPTRESVTLRLVLAMSSRNQVPRLPEAGEWRLGDVALPQYSLYPFEVSAVEKALLLLRTLDEDILVDR